MFKEFIKINNQTFYYSHVIDGRSGIHVGSVHHHTNQCEIILLIGNKLKYILNEAELSLDSHTIIIVPPMRIHAYKNSDSNDSVFECYTVRIDEKILAETDFIDSLGDGLAMKFDVGSELHRIFKKIDNYAGKLSEKDFYDVLYGLMKEVIYNIKISKNDNMLTSGTSISVNTTISNAISYIYENYATIKSISEISSKFFVSERYLNKLFSKHLMSSPKKLLMYKRLSEAKMLISKGIKSSEACYLTGFSDYTVFYRNYKNHFGYPPSKQEKYIENKK